jgi:mitochondrial fission process protein 1
MWGRGSQDKTPKETKESMTEAPADKSKFDANKLPEREKLPVNLQKLVDESDKNENFYDEIVSG